LTIVTPSEGRAVGGVQAYVGFGQLSIAIGLKVTIAVALRRIGVDRADFGMLVTFGSC